MGRDTAAPQGSGGGAERPPEQQPKKRRGRSGVGIDVSNITGDGRRRKQTLRDETGGVRATGSGAIFTKGSHEPPFAWPRGVFPPEAKNFQDWVVV